MTLSLSQTDYIEFLDLISNPEKDVNLVSPFIDKLIAKLSNGTRVSAETILTQLVEETLPVEDFEVAEIVSSFQAYLESTAQPEEDDTLDSKPKVEIKKSQFQIDIEELASKYGIPVTQLDYEVFPVNPEHKRTIVRNSEPTKRINFKNKFKTSAKYKFQLILDKLDSLGLSFTGANIQIGKVRENSLWETPYVVLRLSELDMAVFVSTDEATFLVKGLVDLEEIISTDKQDLKLKYAKRVKKYKFDNQNPENYLQRISLKIAPDSYRDTVVPEVKKRFPTRQEFMNMPYAVRTARYSNLDLDDIAELYSDYDQKLKPTKSNQDLALLADWIYPESVANNAKKPPEKMTAEEWLQELRNVFATPAAMMSSTKRAELKINGWDLNQIAVVVLGERRNAMLETYPKFLPNRINKHLAHLAREVFGSQSPEIESYFWTSEQFAAEFAKMYPDRSSIENLHFTLKQKFSFYGWSLYSLYNKFFGVNANPTSNKAKLAELLDRIYSRTSSAHTESIAT